MAQAQIKQPQEGQPLLGNHPQQPLDVEAGRTQQRVQSVSHLALEVTAIQAVIALEVSNDRLN